MEKRFFPNECFVCKSPNKLSRCSGCNMISYCGRDHQLQHWKNHKSFCKAISEILKREKISHIFEKLHRSDLFWTKEKEKVTQNVIRQLRRDLISEETAMLKFPRVCFVCRETNQKQLKNCPGCPAASFCDLHPRCDIHDKICAIMLNRFDIVEETRKSNPHTSKPLVRSIGAGTKILKSEDDPPVSLQEFFNHYTKPNFDDPERKSFIYELFSISLTTFNILKTLYDRFPPEIVIHIDVGPFFAAIIIGYQWESLLHLIPDVKSLKIVHIEGMITQTKEVVLCKECKSKKRKLLIEANSIPYERYMSQRDYQNPTLIAYFNMSPPEFWDYVPRKAWLNTIKRFSKVTCPMAFTILTERAFERTLIDLQTSSIKFRIISAEFNEFAPLTYLEQLEDYTLSRNSQFMIVFKQEADSNNSESLPKVNRPRSFYYPTICHVCRKTDPKITCNRCRIISYCSNKHRDQDQIHHKDICRIILSLLSEMGVANLFDKAKTSDPDLWLGAKIDLMKKVQMKLGRKLEEYEEQVFLFPKTCAVCHDSDSSLLKSCKCGVSLCKIHKDDPKHTKLCNELSIAFKLSITDHQPNLMSIIAIPKSSLSLNVPSSMQAFIELYFKSEKNADQTVNFQVLTTSNFLTSMLTLHYVMKKLKRKINYSMVIHIIGATREDLVSEPSWKLFLFSLQQLKNLTIIFIGPEISNCPESLVDTSEFSQIDATKSLKFGYHAVNYDKYFLSEKFIKPNIILGCNLNIHETKLGNPENTWKETILTLEKVGVPVVLTVGTKERAEKEQKIFSKLLEKSVDFDCFEENPFASLSPERDFETEGVMYTNKYIIIYNGKNTETNIKSDVA